MVKKEKKKGTRYVVFSFFLDRDRDRFAFWITVLYAVQAYLGLIESVDLFRE